MEVSYVICDSHDHVNHRSLVLKLPMPVAHAVGYVVHGLGFCHIPHLLLSHAKKDLKDQVISQQKIIVPVKWN